MLTFLMHPAPLMTTVNGHELFGRLVKGKISSSTLLVNVIHSSPISPEDDQLPRDLHSIPVGICVNKLHLGDVVLLREAHSLPVNHTNAN